ncbi:MAG: glycosyltransferase [Spirochaetes bacterium]|nr:glycosyltransferase [Spirochaetota bacterium]
MKIAWLSSWPPRPCGIATYSVDLVRALEAEGACVHVVCHTDGGTENEKNVYPVIDLSKPGWDDAVYETVKGIRPDVVHIQHEYGLYRQGTDNASGLFRPLFRWKTDGLFPVAVTYHSVYTEMNRMMSFYMTVLQQLADAGIVHEEYQWARLPVNTGVLFENIYIIPHGAAVHERTDREAAKNALDVGNKRVVGMIGWFNRTKGFHRLIGGWDGISDRLGPDTVLVLAGDARTLDPNQQEYKKKLLELVDGCRHKDRIKIILGSFSPVQYEKILRAFDLMVMPYIYASQSGNLAHSLSLGVPVVATAMEGLEEEIKKSRAGIAVPPDDDEELNNAVCTLLEDDRMRSRYSDNALKYVKNKLAWHRIAHKHLALYDNLIKRKKTGFPDRLVKAKIEPQGEAET